MEHKELSYQCMVDVLIPAYNAEKYILETIESLKNQKMISRIIVVDNNSTDLTTSIVKRQISADPRILLLKEENPGIVSALNRGLIEVRAPYTARLDADDLMMASRIERQVAFLAANPQIDVVGTQIEYIDSNGKHIGFSAYPTDASKVTKALAYMNPLAHSSAMIRTKTLQNLGGYQDWATGAEDLELWIRIAESVNIANLPFALTKYRKHENQMTNLRNLYADERKVRMAHFLRPNGKFDEKLFYFVTNLFRVLQLSFPRSLILASSKIVKFVVFNPIFVPERQISRQNIIQGFDRLSKRFRE